MERHHQWTVDPGPISIILLSPVYFTRTIYFTRIFYCFPLDTLITFVSSKPVRLTTSSQVGNKVLGCVVCRFRVASGRRRVDKCRKRHPCWSVTKPVRITFSRYCPFSPRSTYLGFLTEGKLAAILITPSSWGFQRAGCSPRTRTINCIFTRQLGVSRLLRGASRAALSHCAGVVALVSRHRDLHDLEVGYIVNACAGA
jgi:hypothetical protein